ncbi:hypothetical protein HmCmsJML116_03830 [Escherichia coli]|uniref:hypothetical protein n=1 Tax=Escherichia coli TaxID=562 RepID=UPI000BA989B5|nr:hypothetical protein [Escherichia coli]MCV5818778.1 hypothetical protein [Escherichia coli]PAQ59753.1 hypothetical protein BIZ41_20780 [Escherichia coli]GCW61569.1 hypothetical protein HmCmsJML116_03830 [Escherichia coli]GCZ76329.1 hypothetical protein HmCmsJML136_04494 [Escherichia coli]
MANNLNTAVAQSSRATKSASHSLSDLLKALDQADMYAYLSQISTVYGFPPLKRGMDAALLSIDEVINVPSVSFPNADLKSLSSMIDRINIAGSHVYSIDISQTVGFHKKIQHVFKTAVPEKKYAQKYPVKIYDGTSTKAVTPGTHLTKCLDTGDGYAFVFSYLYNVKIKGAKNTNPTNVPYQFFTTVFIPNKNKRVEYRIPRNLGKREGSKALIGTRNAFNDLLQIAGVNIQLNSLNFYNAIKSILADRKFGRAVQIVYVGDSTGSDANMVGRSDPTYEARDVTVENKKRKEMYSPRMIAVRFKGTGDNFTEVGIDPNKKSWLDNNFCEDFYIDFPADTITLNGLIDNVIARA